MEYKIFISHRSTDKTIADMIVDFLSGIGLHKENLFCSSWPGTDVKEKISNEVKSALKHSVVSIAILSQDYYQSAYCLNEAGVLWYESENVPVIPIALPEITSDNMYGFLNNDYKLRRLDSTTDIAYICDTITERIPSLTTKVSIFTSAGDKLKLRYEEYLKTRESLITIPTTFNTNTITEITTDDERIVLYYILHKNVRKISKATVSAWLNANEIRNVNVDNAFDLLSSSNNGKVNHDTLELSINVFRKCSASAAQILPQLKKYVDCHTELSINIFRNFWNNGSINAILKLFIAYIVDKKIYSFNTGWFGDKKQIESIKMWEFENTLHPTISNDYNNCLNFFIQKDLVYLSSDPNDNHYSTYTLYPSLKEFLLTCPAEIVDELQKAKEIHHVSFSD